MSAKCIVRFEKTHKNSLFLKFKAKFIEKLYKKLFKQEASDFLLVVGWIWRDEKWNQFN